MESLTGITITNSTLNGRLFHTLTHRDVIPYLQKFRLHPDPGTPGFDTWTYGEFSEELLQTILHQFLVASAYRSGILAAMMAETASENWTYRFTLPVFCQLCKRWDHTDTACRETDIDLYEDLLNDGDILNIVNLLLERYSRPDHPVEPMGVVSLCLNRFGDLGAKELAKLIHDPLSIPTGVVSSLILRHNSITDAGVAVIAEALRHTRTLLSLDLTGNPIGNAGITALAHALCTNRTLTSLILKHPSEDPTEETLAIVIRCLRRNVTLCKLVITSRGGSKNLISANREACCLLKQNYSFEKLGIPIDAATDLLAKSRVLLHDRTQPYQRRKLTPELWTAVLRYYCADGPLCEATSPPVSPSISPVPSAAILPPSVGVTSPTLRAAPSPRNPTPRPYIDKIIKYASEKATLHGRGTQPPLLRDFLAEVFDIRSIRGKPPVR